MSTAIDVKAVTDFLNSQSVSAFMGAFAAFVLVAANDWRRERRKVKTLRAEIEVNRADAVAKLETARRARSLLREHNKVNPAPVLRFNTAFTRKLTGEVLHYLSLEQRIAVEALCYTMESIDDLIREATQTASTFAAPLGQAERIAAALRLESLWSDTVGNLKRLIEMCDNYLAGRYTEMVNKQYDAAAYEE